MTNEEKILQMLGELQSTIRTIQADVETIKMKLQISNVHTPNAKKFLDTMNKFMSLPITEEELAEVDELERTIKENRRFNVIADGKRVAS